MYAYIDLVLLLQAKLYMEGEYPPHSIEIFAPFDFCFVIHFGILFFRVFAATMLMLSCELHILHTSFVYWWRR
jgi:hypothetical protein